MMIKIFKVVSAVLLLSFVLAAICATLKFDDIASVPQVRKIVTGKDIAEEISVSRYGIYGVDFVQCGRVRLEKLKRGPFALGGFNVLVLDDLKIVLPGSLDEGRGVSKTDGVKKGNSPVNVLKSIGVGPDFLKANGIVKRFSGLRINGLDIGRLDHLTNVVQVLTARKAELKRGGLELSDLTVHGDGLERKIPKATLKKSDEGLKIVWVDGSLVL